MSALATAPPAAVANGGKTRVLIVEDDAAFARLLRVLVDVEGGGRYELLHAATMAEAAAWFSESAGLAAILLDLSLPDTQGLATVLQAQGFARSAAIIVVTGHDDAETAIAAVAAGAQDYLVKGGLNGQIVIRAIEYAIVRKRLEMERDQLIRDLQSAMDQVRTLEGLLPICARCKRIKNQSGEWEQVEEYVSARTATQFSHALCQPCAHELYPDLMGPDEASVVVSHG